MSHTGGCLSGMYQEIAASQHGLITRAQLRESGLTDAMIDGLLARGLLVRVHRGVYRVAGMPVTWRQSVLAACLAGGPAAVASHRAAAALWGLERVEERVEITVPGSRLPRMTGVVRHRTVSLPRADITSVDGISATRPARTIIDCAAVLPASHLAIALDDALSRGLLIPAHLRRRLVVAGAQGRPGAATLSRLLDERPEGRALAHRAFERLLFQLLSTSGFPRPQPHYPVLLGVSGTAYIDYAWPAHMVGLEADSYRHHSSRTQWSHDHTRNAALTALGWRILLVTYDDVVRHTSRTVALLHQALFGEACRVTPLQAG
jgi:hypothetical protein